MQYLFNALHGRVSDLKIRDKRKIFQWMRETRNVSELYLLPAFGLTVGEFSVFQVLTESQRKKP
jgi:hypothetical protein